ncbi:unnamed protein product [Rhodiola kirilowii]
MGKSAGESSLSEKQCSLSNGSMECVNKALIPGLPDELALLCLVMISHGYLGVLKCVCKRWRDVIGSEYYASYKSRMGRCGDWVFFWDGGIQHQWKAYDPEADRWHDMPSMPRLNDDSHFGFSCVSACNRFLVIGGAYANDNPDNEPIVTNRVQSFDPFRQEWSEVATMSTPRAKFACSVIGGKVYVGGGCSSLFTDGLSSAEVYDPVNDRWDDLPPLPNPMAHCFGISYNGKFHILECTYGQSTMEYSQLDKQWCSRDDMWLRPLDILVRREIVVINDHIYAVKNNDEEKLVEAFNTQTGDWLHLGSVPPVILPDRPPIHKYFGYGVCGLRNKLYVMGGSVTEVDDRGLIHINMGKLRAMRVCDLSSTPLQWRETRPIPGHARAWILACSSLEELLS